MAILKGSIDGLLLSYFILLHLVLISLKLQVVIYIMIFFAKRNVLMKIDASGYFSDFLPFIEPLTDEEKIGALTGIINSGLINTGPVSQELEQSIRMLTGCRNAVAVSSAADGMHITLMAMGIGPGDEVITPSMTFGSTINMIVLLGATPIMVDVDRDNLMVTPQTIEASITPRTRAIIPVHYAGAPADIYAIRQVGKRHGIPVIEDAAHAIGTYYKGVHIGRDGTAIFSFHAIKNVTNAEGGMIVTDDDTLADRLRSLNLYGPDNYAMNHQSHGQAPQVGVMTPAFKYSLTDINAALALVQLGKLSGENARRTGIAWRYLNELANTPFQPLKLPVWDHFHAWYLFMIRVDETHCGISRDALIDSLKLRGIVTGLHFRAVHTEKYYRERFPGLSLPNTEWNSERICSLPLLPEMTQDEVTRIITALQDIAGEHHV